MSSVKTVAPTTSRIISGETRHRRRALLRGLGRGRPAPAPSDGAGVATGDGVATSGPIPLAPAGSAGASRVGLVLIRWVPAYMPLSGLSTSRTSTRTTLLTSRPPRLSEAMAVRAMPSPGPAPPAPGAPPEPGPAPEGGRKRGRAPTRALARSPTDIACDPRSAYPSAPSSARAPFYRPSGPAPAPSGQPE